MSTRFRVYVRREAFDREMAVRNISQNGLAGAMGVSSGYMSQLLSGKRSPSPVIRQRLQQFLQIDEFDAIFRIEGKDPMNGRVDDAHV